jgi:moderate conductance mechanosensitive channel
MNLMKLQLPQLSVFYPFFYHLAHILVIFAGAYVITRLLNKSMPAIRSQIVNIMRRRRRADHELEKRAVTLSEILRNTSAAVVWIVAVVMALKEAGFDIGPILAGAGVVGLAVGFGAQNLVRDFVSGIFILLENQVRVNDVVVINGTGGLVEQINLRTIVLRGQDGTVHIFPNGTINTLSNMTHDYSYYVFDVRVAYKEDTDRVSKVLKEIADEMMKEEEFNRLILAPLEVLGVDRFADSAVILQARIKTRPIEQWTVGREMNRRIKKRFDELGIEIPSTQTSVHFGEISKPFDMRAEDDREEIRALIAEVLEERARRFETTPGMDRRHSSRSH